MSIDTDDRCVCAELRAIRAHLLRVLTALGQMSHGELPHRMSMDVDVRAGLIRAGWALLDGHTSAPKLSVTAP